MTRLRKVTLLLVCVLVIGALTPATGFAAFYNSKSMSADAWWSSWNPENGEPGPGDAIEDWNVSGSKGTGIFKDGGVPLESFKGSMGWASKYSYTPAADGQPATWTEFSCFTESPSVLTFGKSLGSAKLEYLAEATLSVWEGDEPWVQTGPDEWEIRDPDQTSTEMVSVTSGWKATGPLTRSSWVNRERTDDYLWADRSNQSSRKATANVLVVGAGGTVYMSGVLPDAQISDQKSNGRQKGTMPF